MKYILAIVAMLVLTSCKSIEYSDPQGHKLIVRTVITDTSFDNMDVRIGDAHLTLNKYESKIDPEALKVISAALEAALVAAKLAVLP